MAGWPCFYFHNQIFDFEFLLWSVVIVRSDIIDRSCSVVLEICFKGHPKDTIIFGICILQSSFCISSPFVRFIGPIAIPFHCSPRISELDQLLALVNCQIKYWVSMSNDYAFSCDWLRVVLKLKLALIALISSASHYKLHFVRLVELIPNPLKSNVFVFVVERLAWGAWEVLNCLVRLPSNYVLVAAVSLGVGFFKQEHPQFLIPSSPSAEYHSFSVRFHRNIPINFDQPPYSVNAKPDQEITIFEIIILKQALDKAIVLCQPCQWA